MINDAVLIEKPVISIITVSKNSEKHLAQTILSVAKQKYDNIEYIVIDGASTDDTLKIIHKFRDEISYWQSEPDNGIAEAMNKGLKHATGEYVLFLNSDDYLVDEEAIEKIVPHLSCSSDIFVCRIFFLIEGTKVLADKLKFNWRTNFKSSVYHQATFCRRSLFEKVGEFNAKYSIAMDYDFFLRCYRRRIQAKIIDIPFSVMRKDGISSQTDWKSLKERFRQEELVQKANSRHIYDLFVSWLFWRSYLPFKYICYALGRV